MYQGLIELFMRCIKVCFYIYACSERASPEQCLDYVKDLFSGCVACTTVDFTLQAT